MPAENTVEIKMSAEVQGAFDGLKKSVADGKTETMNAVEAVKTEVNKKLDDLDGRVTLIGKTSNDLKKDDPKRGFKNHIEFFNDVIRSGMNGMNPEKMSEHLRACFNTVGSDEARTNSNPDGGFLIPPAFLSGLLTTDPMGEQIDSGALTRKIPMESQVVYLNARVDKNHANSVSGGVRVYRRAETATVTESKVAYEQIKLEANSLMGLSYATEEILARSPISFAALLQTSFADEKISKLNEERLRGTGVDEFMGVLNSPALIEVAKVSNQTADTINGTNLLAMRARAWRYGQCVWMANQDTLTQLMAAHIAGTTSDNYLFAPGNGTDKPDTLLGRPVIFDENMATLGDKGDIALVNWNEYLEGMLGGASFMESMHVRFVYNERAFRFTVYNDGQPWWKSPLTTKHSAVTLSPFVTLAARA
jgi:HK97 family phage major capsid protein